MIVRDYKGDLIELERDTDGAHIEMLERQHLRRCAKCRQIVAQIALECCLSEIEGAYKDWL